jgi:hypothetical protein
MNAVLSKRWTELTKTSTQSQASEGLQNFSTYTEPKTFGFFELKVNPLPARLQRSHLAHLAPRWRIDRELYIDPSKFLNIDASEWPRHQSSFNSKAEPELASTESEFDRKTPEILDLLTSSHFGAAKWKKELINHYINAVQLSFLAEELTPRSVDRSENESVRSISNEVVSSNTVWADSWNEDCSMSESSHGQLETLIKTLYSYVQLPQDWDGYGGLPASLQAVQDAEHFLVKLPEGVPLPRPMLAGSGTVGLYWDGGDLYISLDFEGDNRYTYLIDQNDQYSSDSDIEVEQPIPDDLRRALEEV